MRTSQERKVYRFGGCLLWLVLAGAALLALDASAGVSALEVLGEGRAFDSTLPCGVGGQGVPFRICREALEQPGLLSRLLD